METLIQDARYALRQILRAPWFTATIVVVLSLGIGVTSATLSYVRGVMTIPAPGVEPDSRLMTVAVVDPAAQRGFGLVPISYANFIRFRERAQTFSSLAAQSYSVRSAVDIGKGPEAIAVAGVTAEYFSTLRLAPSLGTLLLQTRDTDGDPDRNVVISHHLWRARFGQATDVIGRRIAINGAPFTIVGVGPERFGGACDGCAGKPMLWVPLTATRSAEPGTSRDSLELRAMFGRLREDVTIENAQSAAASAAVLTLRSADTTTDRLSALVRPMRMGQYEPSAGDSDITFAGVVMGFVALLLLIITCTNVSALLLGRGSARRHEVAVRYSLGASRARVVRQLLTESVLISLVAAGLGVVVLVLVRNAVFAMTVNDTPINLPIDAVTLALSLGTAIITGVAFGISPALHATRSAIADAMKQGSSASDWRRTRAQRAMIVAQLAVSQPVLLAMILALGVVGSQRPWDSPFEAPDNVIGVGLDFEARLYQRADATAFVRTLRERLAQLPGVERTEVAGRVKQVFDRIHGATAMLPLAPEVRDGAPAPATRGARLGMTELRRVGPDYFSTLGLPIVRGRGFIATDTAASATNIVVPEDVAAAFWPNQDPVGRRLIASSILTDGGGMRTLGRGESGASYTVVGVARTQRAVTPNERPSVYMAGGMDPLRGAVILVRTRGPGGALLPAIQREVRQLDPDLPIGELATVAQAERANVGTAGRIAAAASSFSLLALALVALGLAGIVMFAVAQRTREIGVRVALGAQRHQIVGLFVRQGVRTAALGFAIGIPFSILVFIGAMKVYFSASFTLNAMSALTAAVVLFSVVLMASWLPARRAARIDPLIALRSE